MKRLLLLSVLLVGIAASRRGAVLSQLYPVSSGCGSVGSTPAFVQMTNKSLGSVTSGTMTLPASETAGNFKALAVRVSASGRTLTVSDDKANGFQQATNIHDSGSLFELFLVYATNLVGGATTITVAISGAAATINVDAVEYSGLCLLNPLDQVAAATNLANTITSGPVTTAQAKELIFAAAASRASGTIDPGTGYTIRKPNNAVQDTVGCEDQIVTSTGSFSGDFTCGSGNDRRLSIIATFRGK